jgi:hypothetical protein
MTPRPPLYRRPRELVKLCAKALEALPNALDEMHCETMDRVTDRKEFEKQLGLRVFIFGCHGHEAAAKLLLEKGAWPDSED